MLTLKTRTSQLELTFKCVHRLWEEKWGKWIKDGSAYSLNFFTVPQ